MIHLLREILSTILILGSLVATNMDESDLKSTCLKMRDLEMKLSFVAWSFFFFSYSFFYTIVLSGAEEDENFQKDCTARRHR
jgi:hypothetical protein